MPRRSSRDEQPREGTLDMLMSRSSAVRKRLGNLDKVSIEYIEASGDCFYLAMEAALSEGEGWCPYYAVSTQRDVVASSMPEETYEMYDPMHQQQAEGAPYLRAQTQPGSDSMAPRANLWCASRRAGFKFMSGVDSLDSLRKRIRLRGSKVRDAPHAPLPERSSSAR